MGDGCFLFFFDKWVFDCGTFGFEIVINSNYNFFFEPVVRFNVESCGVSALAIGL